MVLFSRLPLKLSRVFLRNDTSRQLQDTVNKGEQVNAEVLKVRLTELFNNAQKTSRRCKNWLRFLIFVSLLLTVVAIWLDLIWLTVVPSVISCLENVFEWGPLSEKHAELAVEIYSIYHSISQEGIDIVQANSQYEDLIFRFKTSALRSDLRLSLG